MRKIPPLLRVNLILFPKPHQTVPLLAQNPPEKVRKRGGIFCPQSIFRLFYPSKTFQVPVAYPIIYLRGDHMIMFGGVYDLYMTSVRSIWRVKAVPAHIWPDLAGGVFLRTGQVSSNTDAATWTSYLLPNENEVACLVASPFSRNTLGNLGHTFTNGICASLT